MPECRMRVDVPGINGTDELYLKVFRSIIGFPTRDKSLIDLCSHVARMTRQLGFGRRVFVDALPRDLGEDQPNFVQCSVLGEHRIFNKHYDVATCMDGIEHIHKDEGRELLARMIGLADKRIIFTPLDPWMMEPDNPFPETHKSVWVPDDVPGWASIVYPQYHPTLDIGAWFGWHCDNIEEDFERVCRELKLAKV